MNKIYKVIFNKAKGVWMAVAEIAKSNSHQKAKSVFGTVAKSALAVAILTSLGAGIGTTVQAADRDYFFNEGHNNVHVTNGGTNFQAGNNSVMVGNNTVTMSCLQAMKLLYQEAKYADDHKGIGGNAAREKVVEISEMMARARGIDISEELKNYKADMTSTKNLLALYNKIGLYGKIHPLLVDFNYDVDKLPEIGDVTWDAPYVANNTAIGNGAVASGGFMGNGATAVGAESYAMGEQSIAVGNNAHAFSGQATAVGSDSYASGYGSVAIGGDDISGDFNSSHGTVVNVGGYKDMLSVQKILEVYVNPASVVVPSNPDATIAEKRAYYKNMIDGAHLDSNGKLVNGKGQDLEGYLTSNNITYLKNKSFKDFKGSYIWAPGDGEAGADHPARYRRMYSPAFADGTGSIAVGSRSIAAQQGATAVGPLAFALGKESTAMGLRTYVDVAAEGGTAIGINSHVFAENGLAVGNNSESTQKHSAAFGNMAHAAGEGSLALGDSSSANGIVTNKEAFKNAVKEGNIGDDFSFEYKGNGDVYMTVENEDGSVHDVEATKNKGDFATAIGHLVLADADNTVAVGSKTYVGGEDAVGIGSGVVVEADRGIAIGKGAQANLANSTALGVNSKTDYTAADLNKAAYVPIGTFSMESDANVGVISVGSLGNERRIVNVAGGYRDTDAVNVGQLKALENRIDYGTENVDKELRYVSIYATDKVKKVLRKEACYSRLVSLASQKARLDAVKKAGGTVNQTTYDKLTTEVNKEIANVDFSTLSAGAKTAIEELTGLNQGSFDNSLTSSEAKISAAQEAAMEYLKLNPEKVALLYNNEDKKLLLETNLNNKGAKQVAAIAIGHNAESTAVGGVSIGTGAKTNGGGGKNDALGIAIGYGADSYGMNVSVGTLTKADELSAAGVTDMKVSQVALGAGATTGTNTGDGNIAMGAIAQSYGSNSVVLGALAQAGYYYGQGNSENYKAIESVAIGSKASARGQGNVVLGNKASTGIGSSRYENSNGAVAIGDDAHSINNGSISIGKGAIAGSYNQDAIDFINAKKTKLTAQLKDAETNYDKVKAEYDKNMGSSDKELVKKVYADMAQASLVKEKLINEINGLDLELQKAQEVGTNTDGNKGIKAIAIGEGSKATHNNSVAIGSGSETTEVHAVEKTTVDGKDFEYAASKAKSVVSVGKAGDERQIVNVGAGSIAKGSTDAINGSQLWATNERIKEIADNQAPDTYVHVNTGEKDQPEGNSTTNLGSIASKAGATGKLAVAIGKNTTASGNVGVAIGYGSSVTASGGVAVGASSVADREVMKNVTTSAKASVDSNQVYAFGNKNNEAVAATVVGSRGAFSVGRHEGKDHKTRQIIHVAAGSEDTDAVNVAQLKSVAEATMIFAGDNNTQTERTLGQTLNIVGDDDNIITTEATEGQIKLSIDKSKLGASNISYRANDSETKEVVDLADGLNFKQVEGETKVTTGANGEVNIALADGLKDKIDGAVQNITTSDKTVVKTETTPGEVDLKVNIDGKTVVKNDKGVISVGEISGDNIKDGSITNSDIKNNTITGDKIANNTIGEDNIKTDTVNAFKQDYSLVADETGSYKVDNNGKVTLKVVDANDNSKSKDVVIEGIASNTLNNITDGGKTVVKNLAKEAVQIADGNKTKVTSTTDTNGNKIYTVGVVEGNIAVDDEGLVSGKKVYEETRVNDKSDGTKYNYIESGATAASNLINLDEKVASNFEEVNKKVDTKMSNWKLKVNEGNEYTVDNDNNLVTFADGDNINITRENGKITIAADLSSAADTNLSNITNEGNKVIKNIAKEAVTLENGNKTTVNSREDENGNKIWNVNVTTDGQVIDNNEGIVTGGTVKTALDNLEIAYKANSKNGQKVKLSEGLNFSDGTNTTAEVDENGVVKFNVSDKAIKDVVDTEYLKKDGSNIDNNQAKFGENVGAEAITDKATDQTKLVQMQAVKTYVDDTSSTINNRIDNQVIKISQNGGTKQDIKLSDGLNFQNGTYTTATVDNKGNVSFDISDEKAKEFEKVSRETVTKNDNYITVESDPATEGADNREFKVGLDIENLKKELDSSYIQKWKLQQNGNDAATLGNDGTLNLVDGDNILITNDGSGENAGQLKISTSMTPEFTTVKTGNATLNTDGLTINNGGKSISIKTTGIDMGGMKINNIQRGTAGTDAVNVDQLKAAIDSINTEIGGVTTNVISNQVVVYTTTEGDVVVPVEVEEDNGSGGTVKVTKYYKKDDVDPISNKPLDGKTAVPDSTLETRVVNPEFDNTKTEMILGNVGSSIDKHIKAADATASEENKIIKPDMTPVEEAQAKVKYLVGDNITANSAAEKKVVNVKDLKDLAVAGLDFEGNDANIVHRNVGEKLGIKGEGVDSTTSGTFKSAAGNINIVKDDSNLIVKLNKDLTNMDSISHKDGAKITLGEDNITLSNADNQVTIKGVKAGEADTDAVNVKQLNDLTIAYKANGQNGKTVTLKNGLDFVNGNNTTATVDENGKVVIDVSDTAKAKFEEKSREKVVAGTDNEAITVKADKKDGEDNRTFTVSLNKDKTAELLGDTFLKVDGSNINNNQAKFGENVGAEAITDNATDQTKLVQMQAVKKYVGDQITNNNETINNTIAGKTFGVKVTEEGVEKSATRTVDNTLDVIDDGNVKVSIEGNDSNTNKLKIALSEELTLGGKDGKDGAIGINGKDGKSGVAINGTDGISIKGEDGKNGVTIKGEKGENGTNGVIGLDGHDGVNGMNGKDAHANIMVANGQNGIDGTNGSNGTDGMTRIVYNDGKVIHEVATLDDGLKFGANSGATNPVANKLGSTVTIKGSGAKADDKYSSANIKTKVTQDVDGNTAIEVMLDKDLNANSVTVGEKGEQGVEGKPGTPGSITIIGEKGTNGKDGKPGTNGKDGVNAEADIKVVNGKDGVAGVDGKDGITRIEYKDEEGNDHTVATLEDGLKFVGDDGKVIAKKLNETLGIKGGVTADADITDEDAKLANLQSKLTDNNIGVVKGADGLEIKLAKDLKDISNVAVSDSIKVGGDDGINISSVTTGAGTAGEKITREISGLTNTSFDVNTTGKDGRENIAATEGQLKDIADTINGNISGKTFGLKDKDGTVAKKSLDDAIAVLGDGNVNVVADSANNEINISLNNNITVGKAGKDGAAGVDGVIGVNGKDGQSGVAINGTDGISIKGEDGKNGVTIKGEKGENGTNGVIGLDGHDGVNGKDGKDAHADIMIANGQNGVDGTNGSNGTDGMTRIVYNDGKVIHEVATLDDGLKFVGDDGKVIAKKLNETLGIKGGVTGEGNTEDEKLEDLKTKLADGNIGVVKGDDGLEVKLAKDITGLNSITLGNTIINNNGLTINNGPSITNNGINAGDKVISNVAAGKNNTDAVNLGQLNDAISKVTNGAGATVVAGTNVVVEVTDKSGDKEYTVNVEGNGQVANDDKGLINGDTLFDEVRVPTKPEGEKYNVISADNTAGDNLVALDKQVGENTTAIENLQNNKLDKDAINNIKGGTGITVTGGGTNNEGNITNGDITISLDEDAIKGVAKDAFVAGDNIEITEGTGENAGKTVIKTKDDVNFDKVTVGDIVLDKDSNEIKGLANTDFDKEKTGVGDRENIAATEGQLKSAIESSTFGLEDANGNKVEKGLNNTISIIGGAEDKTLTDNNIGVIVKDGAVNVKLAEDISGINSITSETVKANEYKVGDDVYISNDGINANDNKVINVADGDVSATSTDAINGSQLYARDQAIESLSNQVNTVNESIGKVGAGASALAALHPLDFDADDKLSFAAGVGRYKGNSSVAMGAYYRPNESTMFSVATTMGTGESNMVNFGVSIKSGRKNTVSNTRVAIAKEMLELRQTVAKQSQQIHELTELVNKLVSTNDRVALDPNAMFPDVPRNHWAYEYIEKLAEKGIIEGYPNGRFDGDRSMTRYEFAAMLYRAMMNGEKLDADIASEFENELGRIRVDFISGDKATKYKVERVRVNSEDEDRDIYGSKIPVNKNAAK